MFLTFSLQRELHLSMGIQVITHLRLKKEITIIQLLTNIARLSTKKLICVQMYVRELSSNIVLKKIGSRHTASLLI